MPLARMEYGTVGQSYVLLKRETGSMTMGKLGACLQFTVKEIDPSTGARDMATPRRQPHGPPAPSASRGF